MEDSLFVLTSKSMNHLRRLGGTASWSLNPSRASSMNWVVCFELQPAGSGSQHYPFLIGELGPITVSPEWDQVTQKNMRYLIQFERVAVIPSEMRSSCRSWGELVNGRNPVKYGSLMDPFAQLTAVVGGEVEFPESLEFISARDWRGDLWSESARLVEVADGSTDAVDGDDSESDKSTVASFTPNVAAGITIDEAKRRLARQYEVSPEAIEIKITF